MRRGEDVPWSRISELTKLLISHRSYLSVITEAPNYQRGETFIFGYLFTRRPLQVFELYKMLGIKLDLFNGTTV